MELGSSLSVENIQQKDRKCASHSPEFYQVPLEEIFGSHPDQSQAKHRVIPNHQPLVTTEIESHQDPFNDVPSLQFSIYYDLQRSTLEVHLLKATHLPVNTSSNKLFVITQLDPQHDEIYESHPQYAVSDPSFEEVYTFHDIQVFTGSVVFRFYEGSKLSKSNFLGSVVASLSEKADRFYYGETTTMAIDTTGTNLPCDSRGDILLSLMYDDAGKRLEVRVVKAMNLRKTAIVGFVDPYIEVHLLNKGLKHAKWRTTIKSNTQAPVFNESNKFNVSNLSPDDLTLKVVIMDSKRFIKDEVMGELYIGKNVESNSGKIHWAEAVSDYSMVAVSHWHSIRPCNE